MHVAVSVTLLSISFDSHPRLPLTLKVLQTKISDHRRCSFSNVTLQFCDH